MDSNDDDLYGDLDLTIDKKESSSKSATAAKRPELKIGSNHKRTNYDPPVRRSHLPKHEQENESLRKKIRILEDENHRLKRNMGTLFRTAKHELKRKDDQIERLQQQQLEQS